MAKKKAVKAEVSAKAAVKGSRGRAYELTDVIAIVTGDGARRTMRGLAVDRTMEAIRACKSPTVGAYLDRFAPMLEAKPDAKKGTGHLPGRSGQPGRKQALGILRWLEKEQAVTVSAKKTKASKPKVTTVEAAEPLVEVPVEVPVAEAETA